jgi:hypothetical protein
MEPTAADAANEQAAPATPQYTPEEIAQMNAARAQATAMIVDTVRPLLDEVERRQAERAEAQSKAFSTQLRELIGEVAKTIPQVVEQKVADMVNAARSGRETEPTPVAPPPQAAVVSASPGGPAPSSDRFGQMLGILQMLGLTPGAQQPQQSNPLALMEQFFGMTSRMNELAAQQNAQLLQGVQLATSVMRGAVSAGADPEDAAQNLSNAFKPKPKSSADVAKTISLNQP